MLRATIDINGGTISQLIIVRDKNQSDKRFRDYTVTMLDIDKRNPVACPPGTEYIKTRIEGYDSKLGPWNLVKEAIAKMHWTQDQVDEIAERSKDLDEFFRGFEP